MQKIKAEVERRRIVSGNTPSQKAIESEMQNLGGPRTDGSSSSTRRPERPVIEGILWKYGMRYASFVKKIPVIKELAEKYYWKLAREQKHFLHANTSFPAAHRSAFDIETRLNYAGFLEQISHEGLKGRIKRLIFHFIGFFAWWQGQINKALYDAIVRMETRQDTQIGDQGAKIKALHDTIADMETELAKRDKMIALLNDRLIILDQLGNCVYEELNRQMAEVARLRVEITGFSDRQEDL